MSILNTRCESIILLLRKIGNIYATALPQGRADVAKAPAHGRCGWELRPANVCGQSMKTGYMMSLVTRYKWHSCIRLTDSENLHTLLEHDYTDSSSLFSYYRCLFCVGHLYIDQESHHIIDEDTVDALGAYRATVMILTRVAFGRQT